MPKTIIPPKLNKGDNIRIIAPSCSGKTISKPKIKYAKELLERLGFKVSYSKNLFEFNRLQSSSKKSRIQDLHDAFKDKSVQGIMAIRGGYNANDLLDYIDWELISKNPKMYCGFSDNTVLENAFLAKTGLVSYSGPNFSSFANPKGQSYTLNNFLKAATNLQTPITELKSYSKITVINSGKATGKIIGGNLCTFNLLQGTQYIPSIKNAILFIEDDFISLFDWWEFCRNLQSVINLPDFKSVRGIAIGKFQPQSKISINRIKEIIESKPELKKIPVIANVNFGHSYPMFTFPVGGSATINTALKEPLSIKY